jgi:hypothetical protein
MHIERSFVDVMSEMVSVFPVVVISWVVHIFAVSLLIGVALDVKLGVVGEEQAVPCAVLLVFSVLLVSERLVVSFKHGALGYIEALTRDHSGEWSHIWARVPTIDHLIAVACVISESETAEEACSEEVPSESLSGKISGINIDEIVDHSLLRNYGDASLIFLSSATHPNTKRSREESTDDGIGPERELILILDLTLVLPCPSLGVSHVLAETKSDPRGLSELILQPII